MTASADQGYIASLWFHLSHRGPQPIRTCEMWTKKTKRDMKATVRCRRSSITTSIWHEQWHCGLREHINTSRLEPQEPLEPWEPLDLLRRERAKRQTERERWNQRDGAERQRQRQRDGGNGEWWAGCSRFVNYFFTWHQNGSDGLLVSSPGRPLSETHKQLSISSDCWLHCSRLLNVVQSWARCCCCPPHGQCRGRTSLSDHIPTSRQRNTTSVFCDGPSPITL